MTLKNKNQKSHVKPKELAVGCLFLTKAAKRKSVGKRIASKSTKIAVFSVFETVLADDISAGTALELKMTDRNISASFLIGLQIFLAKYVMIPRKVTPYLQDVYKLVSLC